MIAVKNLSKHYSVHKRPPGALAALRSLFVRPLETVKAVDDVSFDVAAGERVALLGENGAGKTTTLKVLSGLLHATRGSASVDGHDPRRRDRAFLGRIGLVTGQRQRLIWDLPAEETFELHRAVYDVPRGEFDATLRELGEWLDLGDLPKRPARELSLGERMKCELAAALVHRPSVLFLDEPTIGLDVSLQLAVRRFIQRYNEERGATVLLTSHYMDDVAALCPRVIVMGKGRIAYDGPLGALAQRVRRDKLLVLRLSRPVDAKDLLLSCPAVVVEHTDLKLVLRVDPEHLQAALAGALASLPLHDLTVEDPPLAEVMAELFARERAKHEAEA
jgi:ABC-2 type transport system ATP-binding protein